VAKVARLDVISHLIDEQDFNQMQPVARKCLEMP
jgi:hypothetical protein